MQTSFCFFCFVFSVTWMRIIPENPPLCEEFHGSGYPEYVSFEQSECKDFGFVIPVKEKNNHQFDPLSETFQLSKAYTLSNPISLLMNNSKSYRTHPFLSSEYMYRIHSAFKTLYEK